MRVKNKKYSIKKEEDEVERRYFNFNTTWKNIFFLLRCLKNQINKGHIIIVYMSKFLSYDESVYGALTPRFLCLRCLPFPPIALLYRSPHKKFKGI